MRAKMIPVRGLHPQNKLDRFLIGKKKGEKRAYWTTYGATWIDDLKEREEYIAAEAARLRDISKDNEVTNPRKYNQKPFFQRTMQENRFMEASTEALRVFPKNRPINKEELYPERDYDMYEDGIDDGLIDVDAMFMEEPEDIIDSEIEFWNQFESALS